MQIIRMHDIIIRMTLELLVSLPKRRGNVQVIAVRARANKRSRRGRREKDRGSD
jgi:hypothetical protein